MGQYTQSVSLPGGKTLTGSAAQAYGTSPNPTAPQVASATLPKTEKPPITPTVMTSKPATDHIQNVIQPGYQDALRGINDQALKIKAQLDQNAAQEAQDKATSDAKASADTEAARKASETAAKTAAVSGTPLQAVNKNGKTLTVVSDVPYGNGQRKVTYNDGTTDVVDQVQNDDGSVSYAPNQDYSSLQNAQSDRAAADADYQAKAAAVSRTITNIQNGTVPLTAGEQAQVSALQASYGQLIEQQKLQNTGATGLANIRGYQTGSGEYDPSFQVATIGSIVTAGLNKVADLNTKMAGAVADLTQSFHTNDISAVKDSWDAYVKAATERTNYLDKTITEAQAAIKDAQTQSYKQAQDAIQNQLNSDKFELDKTNATIDNALKNAQITKTQADTLKTQAETTQLNNQLAAPGSGSTAPTVNMTPTGIPDPVSQQAYLAALPGGATGDLATLIKGLTNYQISLSTAPQKNYKGAVGTLTQEQLAAYALQYDPTFDAKSFATRQAMQKNITSGAYSQTITGANTLIKHLDLFAQAAAALDKTGGPMSGLNFLTNELYKATGSPNVNNFNIEAQAIATEAARIYKGVGSTSEEEIKAWKDALSPNASPAVHQAAIQKITELMAGKLSTLSENYTSTMGKQGTFQILTPRSVAVLQKLGIDPSIVDPNYATGPVGQEAQAESTVKGYAAAHPEKTQEIQTHIQSLEKTLGRPATSQEFLQAFPEYGGGGGFNPVGNDTKPVSIVIPSTSHLAYVNNNPGNLRFADQAGASQGAGGFARFSSVEEGYKALVGQIQLDAQRGLSLAKFISKFAPPSENDTQKYIKQVATALGLSPTASIASIPPDTLAKAIAMKESSTKIT